MLVSTIGPWIQEACKPPAAYYASASANEATKEACRRVVVNHVTRQHARSRPGRMLVLPGLHWRAEKALLKKQENMSFVAFERSQEVWLRARSAAPGFHIDTFIECVGRERVPVQVTRGTRYVNADITNFVTAIGNARGPKAMHDYYSSAYGQLTAVWLDYCAFLSPGICATLRRLPSLLDRAASTIPFAITVMLGRERGDVPMQLRALQDDFGMSKLEARAQYIGYHFGTTCTFRYNKELSMTYRSGKNGKANMALIVGDILL